jgi:nicotinate-nucleotide adenylyltransferase
MSLMRIAFFGGSFDPPHIGHLRIARAAAERLHLDRVLLAPVAQQPLKSEGSAGYADRVAMLRLLIAGDTGFQANTRVEISELDAPRPGGRPNYTYETLLALRAQLAPGDTLFVLLGADSFLSIGKWHRATELLLLADWIVAARPGFSLDQLDQALPPTIRPLGPGEPRDGCTAQQCADEEGRTTTLYLLPDLREDVSATEIRAALAERTAPPAPGQPPEAQKVLAPSVVDYIRTHGLYR